jgi:hypothetical protein
VSSRDHGRRIRDRIACVLGAVALLVLLGSFLPISPTRPPPSGASALVPAFGDRNFTLTADGSSPGAVGLVWAGTLCLPFASFDVYVSNVSSGGPWTELATIHCPDSRHYFADRLAPDTPYWWVVTEYNDLLGSSRTNVVFDPTSPAPTTSLVQTAPGTVNVTWSDSSNYTDVIGFVSYEVVSVGGDGAPEPLATLTDSATRSYSLSPVANNTTLSLEVVATDRCLSGTDCGPGTPTVSTASGPASLTTASTLDLIVEARTIATLPQTTLKFTANESGGVAPFTYAWTFGDDANATGALVDHQYAKTGSYTATCWVTDGFGSTAKATVSVRLEGTGSSNGSSGNGSPGAAPPPPSTPRVPPAGESGLASDGLTDAAINDPVLAIFIVAMVAYAVVSRRWDGKPPSPPPAGAAAPESFVPHGRE